MNKNIKIVLKYINKYGYIKNCELYEVLPISNDKLINTLEHLVDLHIIRYREKLEWKNGIRYINEYYYSTLKSENYYHTRFKEKLFKLIRFLFLNLLCPIIVAWIAGQFSVNSAISNNECCNESCCTTYQEPN